MTDHLNKQDKQSPTNQLSSTAECAARRNSDELRFVKPSIQSEATTPKTGGQPSISPPAKISGIGEYEIKPLTSGIDTLVLSYDVTWSNNQLFETLTKQKQNSIDGNKDAIGVLESPNGKGGTVYQILPHGKPGYEWLLKNPLWFLKIGNLLTPQSRPNLVAEFRSEFLWHQGPEKARLFVINLIESQGGRIHREFPSRIDLCIDALWPVDLWQTNFMKYSMTRATSKAIYKDNERVTGIAIGKGNIQARLYDKALEIAVKSQKVWMYPIWKLATVPNEAKIIRTEFQLRREKLKEMGFESFEHLKLNSGRLWSYCTESWLRFTCDPGKQSAQRETLPWWKSIQLGFQGAQPGNPLIPAKRILVKREQLFRQILGLLTSYATVSEPSEKIAYGNPVGLSDLFKSIQHDMRQSGIGDQELMELIIDKQALIDSRITKYIQKKMQNEGKEPDNV